MHGTMDHKSCCVKKPAGAAVDYLALVVDLNQIAALDHGESHSERVYPESGWVDRVSKRDVACYTLVETILAENAEGGSQAAFEVVALFIFVGEFGRAWNVELLGFGFVVMETGLQGGMNGRLLMGSPFCWWWRRCRCLGHGGGWGGHILGARRRFLIEDTAQYFRRD